MVRTIRTCSIAVAAALLAAGPAQARSAPTTQSDLGLFVGARAAELSGDAERSAALYASLARSDPNSRIVANRAIAQAILAGNMDLALRLIRSAPTRDTGIDTTLLLAADHLARGREKDALAVLRPQAAEANLSFLAPFVSAWVAAERGQASAADLLGQVPDASGIEPYLPQHRALILLQLKRVAEAEPFVRTALAAAGGREARLRIAFADAYLRARDQQRAMAVLEGREPILALARERVARGKPTGGGIATAAEAFSELLVSLSIDLNRSDGRSLPIAMAQIARHADRNNAQAAILLALLLGQNDRPDEALAAIRSVPADSVFAPQARDTEIRTLIAADREAEALSRAHAFANGPGARADDWSRVGDAYSEMDRHADAAGAFGRAIALVEAGGAGGQPWALYLLRGGALERADRWPEARAALERAHQLAPDNPLVLNYLGYAKLERGEELDKAEALIAEASRRAPRDASITDSLGWAQFKRGRLEDAIATLERAAASDPGQSEIHEHLGDALYSAGRKFEARHAWNAALITAEDDTRARIEAKIRGGLTPANAAP